MKSWEVVDVSSLTDGANPIGTQWVFKVKYNNGVYENHRARIVALVYRQLNGVGYFETFSPTSTYVSIQLLLALIALPFWYSFDLDAICAYICTDTCPWDRSFETHRRYSSPTWKILSSSQKLFTTSNSRQLLPLICVKRSPRKWMEQLKSDECVFVRYADNIIGIGNPPLNVEDLLESDQFSYLAYWF